MGSRRNLIPLAGVLAGILVAGAGRAFADDGGLPVDVRRAVAKLPRELPANPADWPLRLRYQHQKLRVDRPTEDSEASLREQYRRQVHRLAAAGLDGAAEDADLSGDPSRWPFDYRHEYALLTLDGAEDDAAARRAVRDSASLRERLAKLVDDPALGGADLPREWKDFAVELAVENLRRFADEQMSEKNAVRLALNQVLSFYRPKTLEREAAAATGWGWEALTNAVAATLTSPSKGIGINARLKIGD